MPLIRARVSHPHAHPPGEAGARLERLLAAVAARFPAYHFAPQWQGESRTRVTFTFSKDGRGTGKGSAELAEGRVDVVLEADYALPFFVPTALAEMKVRDEVAKSLRDTFG